MNRREFTFGAGAVGLALTAKAQLLNGRSPISEVILEDADVLIAFDTKSGAITRLMRKKSGWNLMARPELGANFRIWAPTPGRRSHVFEGSKQNGADVQKISANEVRIHWPNMVSDVAGKLPIAFTAQVTLTNGQLRFSGEVENKSKLTIESVQYPIIGDLKSPSRGARMWISHMWYDNINFDEIAPHFENKQGYWGVTFPHKGIRSRDTNLFAMLQTEGQGMYCGLHDETVPYMMDFTFEQHPGVIDPMDSLVPATDEISGLKVFLEYSIHHFLFAQPGATRKMVPIAFEGYDGDWQAGLDVYKRWRKTWFAVPHLPEWAKDVHSWLQLQIGGAEEDFLVPYKHLPKYIDECAENGVTAIQLVGWAKGGQDRGDPIADVDPGLGTHQDLKDAIAYANSKGVKMILFGKLNYADMSTEAYRTELHKYEMKDPFGVPYQQNGYSYTTPTQLAGLNNRRRAVMDMCDKGYRDVCVREFNKIVALGSSGWLWDEICGYAASYNFAPGHGYQGVGYVYHGVVQVAKQLRDAGNKASTDFLFAGEAPHDYMRQWFPFSYARIHGAHKPCTKYIDHTLPSMMAVTGIDSREILNRILMYGYVISYEAYNFKGHVNDFPKSLAYGKKIDALRRRYADYLWNGEVRDVVGATVEPKNLHTKYSVFVTAQGKRAVVVINDLPDRSISAKVTLPSAANLKSVSPEAPDGTPTAGEITIPARSAVVVIEA